MGKGKKQAHAKRANVPSGNALDVRIRGSEAAVGLIVDADNGVDLQHVSGEGDEKVFRLERWGQLSHLLKACRAAMAEDSNLVLLFSPLLSQDNRQHIHKYVQSPEVGSGVIQTISEGVGKDRSLSVMRTGSKKRGDESATELDRFRAYWLWIWAKEARITLSRDEAGEMLRLGSFTPDVRQLWDRKTAQQKEVEALCSAAAAGDLAALEAAIKAAGEGTISAGTPDVEGRAPLHVAAAEGRTEAVQALLDAGAPIDGPDGRNRTPLLVARKAEQSDVEGLLLRAGAHDPSGSDMPVVSESFPPEGPQERSSSPPEGSRNTTQPTTPDSEVEELAHVKSPAKDAAPSTDDSAASDSTSVKDATQKLMSAAGNLVDGSKQTRAETQQQGAGKPADTSAGTAGVSGKGAEAHDEGGVKTGRQANPAYKRPQPDEPSSQEAESPTSSAGFAGGGAEAHNEGGIKTGREANPAYKRPKPDQPDSSEPPAPTAGFAGGGAGAHAEEGVKTGRQADPDYKRTGSDAAQGSKPPAPTAGFAGGGAEAHSEAGVKTGRQADPGYKRPQPEQQEEEAQAEPQEASAGDAGRKAEAGTEGQEQQQGQPSSPQKATTGVSGGGAGQHSELGVKTGREADPSYKRPQPDLQDSGEQHSSTAGVSGGGAGAHAEGGVKIGRQADPDYKRPETKQHPSSPSASSAGFAGGGAGAHAEEGVKTGRQADPAYRRPQPEAQPSSPSATAGFAGGGAGQHAEEGVKTGRQADADYKRPQPNQHPSSPSASSAGFTGGGAGAHAEGGVKTGRQADPAYSRPQPEPQPSSPSATAGVTGGGAGQHAEEGVKTGRQADPDYKRPQPQQQQQPSSPSATTAGFAGGGAGQHAEDGIKTGRQADSAYRRPQQDQALSRDASQASMQSAPSLDLDDSSPQSSPHQDLGKPPPSPVSRPRLGRNRSKSARSLASFASLGVPSCLLAIPQTAGPVSAIPEHKGNLSELDEEEPVFEDADLSGMARQPSGASQDRHSGMGHWKGGSRAALPSMLSGADDTEASQADAGAPDAGADEALDDEEFQLPDKELTPEGAKEADGAQNERSLGAMRWRGASRKALPAMVAADGEDADGMEAEQGESSLPPVEAARPHMSPEQPGKEELGEAAPEASEEELEFEDQNVGPEGEDGPERSLASSRWQGKSTAALPTTASGPVDTAELQDEEPEPEEQGASEEDLEFEDKSLDPAEQQSADKEPQHRAYWRGGSTKAQPSLAGVNKAVSRADLAAEDPDQAADAEAQSNGMSHNPEADARQPADILDAAATQGTDEASSTPGKPGVLPSVPRSSRAAETKAGDAAADKEPNEPDAAEAQGRKPSAGSSAAISKSEQNSGATPAEAAHQSPSADMPTPAPGSQQEPGAEPEEAQLAPAAGQTQEAAGRPGSERSSLADDVADSAILSSTNGSQEIPDAAAVAHQAPGRPDPVGSAGPSLKAQQASSGLAGQLHSSALHAPDSTKPPEQGGASAQSQPGTPAPGASAPPATEPAGKASAARSQPPSQAPSQRADESAAPRAPRAAPAQPASGAAASAGVSGAGAQQHDDAGLKTGREAAQQQSAPQGSQGSQGSQNSARPVLPARQRSSRRAGSTEIVPAGPPDAPEASKSAQKQRQQPQKPSKGLGGGPEDEGAPSSLYLWGIGAAVLVGAVSVAGLLLGGSRSRPARPARR